jgi:disulfide bond formation protein DsbB
MLSSVRDRRLLLIAFAALCLSAGCGPSESSGGGGAAVSAATHRASDARYGELLYAGSCKSCHGARGQGMPHQGVDLRGSTFIAARDDQQLIAFIKKGRLPGDPESVQGLIMPPRGGNPALDDTSLAHIVAFLRQIQQEAQGQDQRAAAAAAAAAVSSASANQP